MQSILRWSLEHSTPLDSAASDRPPVSHKKIDPEIIDVILGKSDAELMKEDMAVATDVTKNKDDRLTALDHLEMLVEQIDNANDLAKLKLWDPLVSLLNSEESSIDIKAQVLWIIGTAIQNNPTAQDEYLSLNPLPTLLAFLTLSPPSTVAARSKAIYVLSGLLKHNAPAVAALGSPEVNGWPKLRDALKDPEISVRTKLVFLLNALLTSATSEPTENRRSPSPSSRQYNGSAPTPGPALHTVDEPTSSNSEPIHANSHAAHLEDPCRADTSKITRIALEECGFLDTLISTLTGPVPDGKEGDQVSVDFEEKALCLLSTYLNTHNGKLSDAHGTSLRQWIKKNQQHISDFLSSSEIDALL